MKDKQSAERKGIYFPTTTQQTEIQFPLFNWPKIDSQLRENQVEIRFYIFQNLQHIVNLLYSTQAIIDYFEKNSNHPLINLSKNKIISQINLANITLFDLQVRYSNKKDDLKEIQECKDRALHIIKVTIQILNKDLGSLIKHYINHCFSQEVKVEYLPLQPQIYNHQLDFAIVKEIFVQLVKCETNIEELKKRKEFPLPNIINIVMKANQLKKQTEDILAKTFSKTEKFFSLTSSKFMKQTQQISFAQYQVQVEQFRKQQKEKGSQKQSNGNWKSTVPQHYLSSEYDPKNLPQGPLTQVKVILLQCNCPNTCICGGKQVRKWYHQHCRFPAFINSNGDIFCKNFKNKECAGYFIQYAKFQCDKAELNTTWLEYRTASTFLMALAQGQQSAEFILDDNEMVEFTTTLNSEVFKRWNR